MSNGRKSGAEMRGIGRAERMKAISAGRENKNSGLIATLK
jgi:hypothetical protein